MGYSSVTADNKAYEMIERAGVRLALAAKGFTVPNAQGLVSQCLHDQEADYADRLRSADMIFRVNGMYIEKHLIATVSLPSDIVNATDADLLNLIDNS